MDAKLPLHPPVSLDTVASLLVLLHTTFHGRGAVVEFGYGPDQDGDMFLAMHVGYPFGGDRTLELELNDLAGMAAAAGLDPALAISDVDPFERFVALAFRVQEMPAAMHLRGEAAIQ